MYVVCKLYNICNFSTKNLHDFFPRRHYSKRLIEANYKKKTTICSLQMIDESPEFNF